MLSIHQVMCPQKGGYIGDIICKTPENIICTVRRSRDHQTLKGMQIKIYTGRQTRRCHKFSECETWGVFMRGTKRKHVSGRCNNNMANEACQFPTT